MFRIISSLLWLLLLTATPIAAQNNPILTATNSDKELLYMPEMPSSLPPAEPSLAKEEPCDIIELKKGGEILAHIIAIENTQIKYQKCGKIKRIDRIINKLHVTRVRYANGTVVEIQKQEEEKEAQQKAVIEERRSSGKGVDVLGTLSILCAFAGIFFAGIIFGLLAFILGIASIMTAKRSKIKNRSSYILGVLGIILGLLVVFGTITTIPKLF